MGSALFRFPLLPDMRRRLFHVYLDKLYGPSTAAWAKPGTGSSAIPTPSTPLRAVAGHRLQLRLDSISYYSLPTRAQADLARGSTSCPDAPPGNSTSPCCSVTCRKDVAMLIPSA